MEAKLQAKIIEKCKEYGILAFKTVAVGRRGFPDLTLILPGGVVVFIELKTKTGKLRPNQIIIRDKLLKQGANIHVIRSVEEFTALLRTYL